MKKPTKILLGLTAAAGLGVLGLGFALPASASSAPASHHVVQGDGDGETADDATSKGDAETADDQSADPVDGKGVEDGAKDGETADD